MATRIVGLDIGSKNIRALVMETGFRSFELVEAFEEAVYEADDELIPGKLVEDSLPDEDANDASGSEEEADARTPVLTAGQLDALDLLAERGAFDVDRIYTNFPEALVYFTEISLPFSSAEEVEAVLAPQLDGRLPVDVEELLLDFMFLSKTADGENSIYAGGARTDDVQEYLSLLQTHDLDPRVFDVSPFHLWTGARFLTGSKQQAIAFIDFGAENTRILIYRGDELELSRTVHDGGELVTRRLAEQFELSIGDARDAKHKHVSLMAESESSDSDAIRAAELARAALRPIVREIRRTLQSHAHKHSDPVETIFIGGGGAELAGLDLWLEQNIGIQVRGVPFEQPLFAAIPAFNDHGLRFVGALGLALRGTTVEPASTFNLRKGPFSFRGSYSFISERVSSLAWMAALLVFAFSFYLVGKTTLLKKEYEAVQSALATTTQQTFGAPISDPELVITRLQRGASSSSVMPKDSAYDVMIDIAEAVVATQDAQFVAETTSMEIDMQRATVRLGGTCESAEAADTLASKLESARCLTNVNRTSLSENRGGSGFEFAFQASVRCSNETNTEEDS